MSAKTTGTVTTASRRRRYESPLRAQQVGETKARIIAAATELFTTRGWAATGMRDVAVRAGVAVETLYAHHPSKRALFDAVLDQAVVGDSAPIAVAERPEFLAMGRGSRTARIAAAAKVLREIHERTLPFARLVREAASTDPEIATVLRDTRERQRADVAAAIGLVLDRPPTDEERDGVWAIVSADVSILLVDESGWSFDRYEAWIASTLARVLPRT